VIQGTVVLTIEQMACIYLRHSTDPTEAESERDQASQTQNPMQDLFGRLDGAFVWKLESSQSSSQGFGADRHYRKDGFCRAPNDLPGVPLCRARRSDARQRYLHCAFIGAVRRVVGARQRVARARAPPVSRRTAGADVNGR
jgi:hypothetical protein